MIVNTLNGAVQSLIASFDSEQEAPAKAYHVVL